MGDKVTQKERTHSHGIYYPSRSLSSHWPARYVRAERGLGGGLLSGAGGPGVAVPYGMGLSLCWAAQSALVTFVLVTRLPSGLWVLGKLVTGKKKQSL